MAASRLLGAAAACVILVSFAAGHRKSYWSGCIKAEIVICQQIFSIVALLISFQILLKKCFKIVFFCFGAEIQSVFGLQFLLSVCTRKFLSIKTFLCKSLHLCKLCSTK